MRVAAFTLIALLACTTVASAQKPSGGESCQVSPLVSAAAPPDPNADPIGGTAQSSWYINGDRTIWAGPVPISGWSAGERDAGAGTVRGNKTYWVRPAGADLVITGRRLDAEAPGVEAGIPCCYPTGFQIVDVFFPTEGCWQVTARAAGRELTFVTFVGRTHTASRR